MKSSDYEATLKAFYIDYLAWIDDGADIEYPFSKSSGLCAMLEEWAFTKDIDISDRDDLGAYLTDQFVMAGLDCNFPFSPVSDNRDDLHQFYSAECAIEGCHLNPKRLAWVRERVKC